MIKYKLQTLAGDGWCFSFAYYRAARTRPAVFAYGFYIFAVPPFERYRSGVVYGRGGTAFLLYFTKPTNREVVGVPRTRDPNRERAFEIFKENDGKIDLVEIASQLNIPAGTVRGWKSKDGWERRLNGTFQKNTERSKKRGAQPGNKNSSGGPPGNKKAEKYGFFSKYLPEETKEIFDATSQADPLDLLWHQIQIAYAAIVRAQRIAYVKDRLDKTTEKVGSFDNGDTYEIQQAWDRQNNFLKAQARAQAELRSMIKQYDEMLHSNWELVSEEQRTRIEVMKAKAQLGEKEELADDGFLEALKGSAAEDWADEEETDTDL